MYLEFFESKGHLALKSFSLVPKNDNSLLLINAGMAPLKPYFTGQEVPPRTRVTTCQKCIRTGDIENVGKTARHGTFFEMLGNFSFGDYFKHEAIAWSWEFLTKVIGLDPDRLYPSVYEDDDEAFEIWEKEIGIAPERIFRFGKEDNFWEHGAGPCGPCSEIYYDRGEKYGCGSPDCTVGCDCDRYMEVWNNVFTQFENDGHNHYTELENKNIDTGMGLERLAVVVQEVDSIFDVDSIKAIRDEICKVAGVTYGADHETDVSIRVITDHIRSATFMLSDGITPSNEGRGYVLRRLIRRAARHGRLLGIDHLFLTDISKVVIRESKDGYPELEEKAEFIFNHLSQEEKQFNKTIDQGLSILADMEKAMNEKGSKELAGADAFKLYDTYGFPLDLTELILRENGMEANIDEFNVEMQKQKDRARNAAAIETGDWVVLKEGGCNFVGYDLFECDAEILRYRQIKQKNKVLYQVVLDQTPFYAEMGGQVGDTGWLIADDETIDVIDTKRENNLPVHLVTKLPKDVTATFTAKINEKKRIQCECNHSATHLLHEALREVLGTHVEQKGSYVSPDSLRFDFSHFQKVTDEEIRKVEKLVSEKIRANYPLEEHRNMPIAEAKALGAMALFGEKYGDEVRVVKYGNSIELCGGTHIPATGMIGSLRVVGESSIAAGVRRIEAVTAEAAENYTFMLQDSLRELRAMFNNVPNLSQTIKKAIEENAELKKQVSDYVKEKVQLLKKELIAKAVERNGVKVIAFRGEASVDAIKDLAFQIKGESNTEEKVFFVAGIKDGEKCALMVMLSEPLVAEGLNAGKLVKEAAKLIQGGGGGQPHFATAGGKNVAGLGEAIEHILDAAGLK